MLVDFYVGQIRYDRRKGKIKTTSCKSRSSQMLLSFKSSSFDNIKLGAR